MNGARQIGRCYTHSLLRRVISVITRYSRWSWILPRCLHTFCDFLEPILSHLNPLCHITHCRVFCKDRDPIQIIKQDTHIYIQLLRELVR